MEENVFMTGGKVLTLEDYLQYDAGSRGNLGEELPVMVYRLLEYSLKEELIGQFGKEKQIEIFRNAGRKAGEYFAKKMLNLDLLNYLVLSSKAARYMKAHEVKGCIINITSSRAERAYPGDCVYGGIKAAVNRASQSMALDLAPYGIRVNCVAPGAICIRTPEEIKAEGRTELEGFWESLGERIPMGRNGTPKDIGRAVVFLASENAAYITGEVLRVDGGLILPGMPEKIENDKNAWGGEK